jgi:uncharacterized phage protein (TIGR01671 family)
MNRDIEFRGKDIRTGKWVYGFYYKAYGKHVIWGCVSGGNTQCVYGVIPETVGQYTGLKDRNGVKIFEGDILGRLFDDYNENTVVVYKEGILCAKPISKEKYRPLNTFDGCGWVPVNSNNPNYNFEVIGNIHDNPELLEEIL